MKIKTTIITVALAMTSLTALNSCGGNSEKSSEAAADSVLNADSPVATKKIDINEGPFRHTYLVADQTDEAHIYKKAVNKSNTFFIISKKEYRLYVYEVAGNDTVLAATFPCCYAINPEAKEGEGDNKTPECTMDNPFTISQLQDASTWCFDFNDGRGPIKAFGDYFLRLDLSKSFPDNAALAANRSVGIHGSTGNERSIPGRDSHGCVRLYDNDLITVHDNYAQLGTKVIIKSITANKYPFEVSAQSKLGDKYIAPQKGWTDKFSTKTAKTNSAAAPAANDVANDAAVEKAAKASSPSGATSAAGGTTSPAK